MNVNFCLCKCFTELYFFYWLLVVSLALMQFSSLVRAVCFHRSCLQEYSKMSRVSKTLYKITHRYNWNHQITKNNNNKLVIMLRRNSIKVHSNTRPHWQFALEMNTGWPYGWFWNIFGTVSLKPTIDRPEYWLSAICLEKLWNAAYSVRGLYDK